MTKIIKNVDSVAHTYCGQEILANSQYTVPTEEIFKWSNDSNVLIAIANSTLVVNDGAVDISDINYAINFLKDNLPIETKVTEQPPFAQPTYITKRTAVGELTTLEPNSSSNIDFQLTAERYVTGGCLLAENAQFGDYVTAEVYDKDSVIPEAYRAVLCENWPTVARYVEKEWIEINVGGLTRHKIDTYPLNAKLTAGLYLRLTYYAIDAGSNRKIAVNYYLTKKL